MAPESRSHADPPDFEAIVGLTCGVRRLQLPLQLEAVLLHMAQLLAMTALELLIMAPAILTSLATTVGSIAPVSRLERALGLAVTIGSALETGSRERGKQNPLLYMPMRFISLIGGSHSILEVVIGEIILIAEDSHQYRIPGRHLPHSNAHIMVSSTAAFILLSCRWIRSILTK